MNLNNGDSAANDPCITESLHLLDAQRQNPSMSSRCFHVLNPCTSACVCRSHLLPTMARTHWVPLVFCHHEVSATALITQRHLWLPWSIELPTATCSSSTHFATLLLRFQQGYARPLGAAQNDVRNEMLARVC